MEACRIIPMNITETTLTVGELEDGDFLLDLDHGYVVANETARDEVCWQGLAGALDERLRLVTFHDQHGNENYLLMDEEHPIRVGREV